MNLLTDLLTRLDVPFTERYSTRHYEKMPFRSLFGLQKLLAEYGIDSEGIQLSENSQMSMLDTPFVAETRLGPVVVSSVCNDTLTYLSKGASETMPFHEFAADCTGRVFIAMPRRNAVEPGYTKHRISEITCRVRDIALPLLAIFIFAYFYITRNLYTSWSQTLLLLFNAAGLLVSCLLMKKTLHFRSAAADRMCKVLQAGGCDTVLETTASKFLGVFSWSEVGFTYFSVSFLTLLIFPEYTGYLCLLNACCLPFTCWSIWYQKFRANAWCTMCVTVQATLWVLFFIYLGGGWWHTAFPLRIQIVTLIAVYGTVLLGLSKLTPILTQEE